MKKRNIFIVGTLLFLAACGDDKPADSAKNSDVVTITNKTVSGVAQKGPFSKGSLVTVEELDDESFSRTGNSYESEIEKSSGKFTIKLKELESQYAIFKAEGSFLNEVTGNKSDKSIALHAFTDLSKRDEVNVNLLTQLTYERILYLVAEKGLSVAKAKSQSEAEILKSFAIDDDFESFEDFNIFGDNPENAALLAVSVLMLGDLSEENFVKRINRFTEDIKSDGVWDDSKTATKIADWANALGVGSGLSRIREKIMKWNLSKTVPEFEKYVNNFWQRNYGLGPCNKKNEGEIKKNQNDASVYAEDYFICESAAWRVATVYERDSVLFWNDSSTKNTAKIGDSTGLVYISDDTSWNVSSYNKDEMGIPVDYSLGRAMNKRLGKGINLGNSWDSDGNDDSGWGNRILDEDFAIIKAAGFNSVRIPVRWQKNSDYATHTVDPERLAGVMEDVELAIANGLAVIVNFHHYNELNCVGGGVGANCSFDSTEFQKEKEHFLQLWAQVASTLNIFPDDKLVLEILNEPTIRDVELVNSLLMDAYKVIRTNAPGKTIMFEAYHAAKFEDLATLKLPQDGNIIYSGHYYEPYAYTHQGHSYACK